MAAEILRAHRPGFFRILPAPYFPGGEMTTKHAQTEAARRIAIAMLQAARSGSPMSIKRFLDMAAEAGLTDGESILRLAIRLAWFNAEIARAALEALEAVAPGQGDQFMAEVVHRVELSA
jgi:hypothetical protein